MTFITLPLLLKIINLIIMNFNGDRSETQTQKLPSLTRYC